ncbi:MAG TPA: hypothetical protein VNJ03_12760 [Vicinamibacterales bacterium]|nr:hypothetical protein [Vicinamibacterales bacterium]
MLWRARGLTREKRHDRLPELAQRFDDASALIAGTVGERAQQVRDRAGVSQMSQRFHGCRADLFVIVAQHLDQGNKRPWLANEAECPGGVAAGPPPPGAQVRGPERVEVQGRRRLADRLDDLAARYPKRAEQHVADGAPVRHRCRRKACDCRVALPRDEKRGHARLISVDELLPALKAHSRHDPLHEQEHQQPQQQG